MNETFHRKIFAKRLKRSRIAQGFTQLELGEKIGIPSSSVCKFESCEDLRMPDFFNVIKLSKALKVRSDYLLGLNVHPFKIKK